MQEKQFFTHQELEQHLLEIALEAQASRDVITARNGRLLRDVIVPIVNWVAGEARRIPPGNPGGLGELFVALVDSLGMATATAVRMRSVPTTGDVLDITSVKLGNVFGSSFRNTVLEFHARGKQ